MKTNRNWKVDDIFEYTIALVVRIYYLENIISGVYVINVRLSVKCHRFD